jgi:hypothetical protein
MPVSAPAHARAYRHAAGRAVPGLAVLLLTLAGCGGSDLPKFAPACPQTGILRDGADLTRFRANGTDLTDMVLDGRITGLSGKCSLDDPTHLHTVISVSMDLTRGPAALGRQADVTYFLSVSRGDTILDKADYTFNVNFPNNSDRVRLVGDQIDLVLPVDAKLSGAAYSVLVGFQLTPEQLAFNRRRGVR